MTMGNWPDAECSRDTTGQLMRLPMIPRYAAFRQRGRFDSGETVAPIRQFRTPNNTGHQPLGRP
jgi:hypothetical protein